MTSEIGEQIEGLRRMTTAQLKTRWAEVFGEPTKSNHRTYLIKRIAWRIQALAEGGLSERARSRALELANDADIRVRPPVDAWPGAVPSERVLTGTLPPVRDSRLPPAGALITRDYKGHRIVVRVLERGFECQGVVHRSLTSVARAVTGAHWNGNLFFGLAPSRKGRSHG